MLTEKDKELLYTPREVLVAVNNASMAAMRTHDIEKVQANIDVLVDYGKALLEVFEDEVRDGMTYEDLVLCLLLLALYVQCDRVMTLPDMPFGQLSFNAPPPPPKPSPRKVRRG